MTVAYTPKAAFRDPDALGSVYVNDTLSVNVRELYLASADGVILVDDPIVEQVLDRYEPLKRTTVASREVPEGVGVAPASDIDALTKKDLLALPDVGSIDGAKTMNPDELRAAVKAQREKGGVA